jgi:hypothetical protein
MKRRVTLLSVVLALLPLLLGARALPAQGNTAETLERAVKMYEELQVERALVLLRRVISPSSPFEVSREQRVRAYTYLGASLAIMGMRDSAVVYFRAALERDPFLELQPERFTAAERDAFAEARRRSLSLGLRPVKTVAIEPGREQVPFGFVTTHQAIVRVEIRSPGAPSGHVIEERESDGAREVGWTGLLGDGRLAPPGAYELAVSARSLLGGAADSGRAYFVVRHDFPALEDTLPDLRPDELLPERHSQRAVAAELLKGFGLAAAALAVPATIGSDRLGEGRSLSAGVAAAAGVAGIAAFVARRNQREIPEHVAENRRRQELRASRNAEIARRNEARLAETRVVVTPGVVSEP